MNSMLLTAGAVALVGVFLLNQAASAQVTPTIAKPDVIQVAAKPFEVSDVSLLPGKFKDAQTRDVAYLLTLDPDRLYSGFRIIAGLKPRGERYGGWEMPPRDGRHSVAGALGGHYLTALSMLYADTRDEKIRERISNIVADLAECQEANGEGSIIAYPDGKRIFAEISRGEVRNENFDLNGGWVPWYTNHKVMAGLRDAYQLAGNAQALEMLKKFADFSIAVTANLDDEKWQRMLTCEHGGMNEVLADLYAITGEEKYLALSKKFHHAEIIDPLADHRDILPGKHGNTQIPKMIGLARLYELTGDTRALSAASFFFDTVVNHHSYVTGGNTDGEHFGQPDKLNDRLGQSTTETCNVYNMLKLDRHLFSYTPNAWYADYAERALFNQILASQNPKTGMLCYYLTLKQGGRREYSTPFDSMWCCVCTGIENHVSYGRYIYFHSDSALYVCQFIASKLDWKAKGLTVTQETSFPESDTTKLTIAGTSTGEIELKLRHPKWAEKIEVKVNGETVAVESTPGSFASIKRAWKDGDVVELKMPMTLRLEAMPDNPNRVAACFGPVVLAADLGDSKPKRLPAFVTDGKSPANWLKPDGEMLTFKTVGVAKPDDVTFIPNYRVADKHYSVYVDTFTDQQWSAQEAKYREREAAKAKLEKLTLDTYQPNEQQSETDHNLKGERTRSGDFQDKFWRDATDGGWFSFTMKVQPQGPNALLISYWGGDNGRRDHDIVVDDQVVATQKLNRNMPEEIFDVRHDLPESLTNGKDTVTVRIQAHPKNLAGGILFARTVKGDAQ